MAHPRQLVDRATLQLWAECRGHGQLDDAPVRHMPRYIFEVSDHAACSFTVLVARRLLPHRPRHSSAFTFMTDPLMSSVLTHAVLSHAMLPLVPNLQQGSIAPRHRSRQHMLMQPLRPMGMQQGQPRSKGRPQQDRRHQNPQHQPPPQDRKANASIEVSTSHHPPIPTSPQNPSNPTPVRSDIRGASRQASPQSIAAHGGARPRRQQSQPPRGGAYSCLNASIGSMAAARRAG